jgi:Protein of unknown function (DUF1569)
VLRSLQLDSLNDLRGEIRRLQDDGCRPTGNWNLAQTCRHLNAWMQFPMDGFPRQPLPVRALFGLMRATIGKRSFRRILAEKKMPSGGPTIPQTVYPADRSDEAAAVSEFLATIDRLDRHGGPIHPSPLFGTMTRDECIRLQLIHCAHHLAFLEPGR